MNSKEIQSLAKKLAANPNFLREVEEETMRDLLLDYSAGLLDPDIEQEVCELIVSDPVAAAMWKNFNDIDARLRSPEGLQWTEEAGERILSNMLSEKLNITERIGEAVEQVASKIKYYRDLLFHVPQFAGGTLKRSTGGSSASGDKPREVVLAEEFNESELSRIPWAGPKVKLSKTVDSKKGTAIYHAFVTSINLDAPKTGVLRIVLITPDDRTAEARIKSNDRKKMVEGVELPADSSELRYSLFIE